MHSRQIVQQESYFSLADSEHYPEAIHVAIRFSDKLHSTNDVIGEHNEVLDRKGEVWLGKLGKPLAQRHVETIRCQVSENRNSYLYLVRKDKQRQYQVFRGSITDLIRADDPALEEEKEIDTSLIPPYYDKDGLQEQAGLWIRLSGIVPLPPDEFGNVKVLSSNMPLIETLRSSYAGMFIVKST